MISFLILSLLFVSAALCFPIDENQREFLETSEPKAPSRGWSISEVDLFKKPFEKRRVIVALKQRNTEALEEIFWRITNPKNKDYGKYLTIDEITDLVSPSEETISTVLSWLHQNGITSYTTTQNRDFITFYAPLEQLEDMFSTQFHVFKHESGAKYTSSLGPYSVPKAVKPHLDFVGGITGFPSFKNPITKSTVGAVEIGPQDLRKRYNVSDIGGSEKNSQAVAEFQAQYFSPSDLTTFFKQQLPSYNTTKYATVTKIIGDNEPNSPGVEASLDIQYIMGVAPGVPTWFWSNPAFDFWSDLTAWVSQMNDNPDTPWVHSVSYGSQGNYPSEDYRNRLNTEFQKLGARGISIIFASGDSGTGCNLCFYFEPSFPATSPYVTSVGATRFLSGTGGDEAAVQLFSSGGGFSWLFDAPDYQTKEITHYLNTEKDLPDSGYFNKGGRSTPDVAALGVGFKVVVNGATQSVAGTSASAPTFSAVISLLNEQRIKAGKSTLGFLNTWIYQTYETVPTAFYDVTIGDNQYSCCGLTGFNCNEGYDPVTGVGTPNYSVLKASLP